MDTSFMVQAHRTLPIRQIPVTFIKAISNSTGCMLRYLLTNTAIQRELI